MSRNIILKIFIIHENMQMKFLIEDINFVKCYLFIYIFSMDNVVENTGIRNRIRNVLINADSISLCIVIIENVFVKCQYVCGQLCIFFFTYK
jgi:hypothetical protein